jgi:hypothetical protein
VYTRDAKSLGEKVERGRKVVGFAVETHAGVSDGMDHTLEVWADAETKLPVRVVETMRPEASPAFGDGSPDDLDRREHPEKYTVVRTLTEIRFDVGVGEGAFSVEAPEGYVVREERVE